MANIMPAQLSLISNVARAEIGPHIRKKPANPVNFESLTASISEQKDWPVFFCLSSTDHRSGSTPTVLSRGGLQIEGDYASSRRRMPGRNSLQRPITACVLDRR